MQIAAKKLGTCLWFDTQAEEAANFYVSVFRNSKLGRVSRYAQDVQGKKAGSVMVAEFEINGQAFTALNGGPQYKFTEAVSFQVACDSQEEIDYFWGRLIEGGEEGPCGWLKDKYGVSWQVFPSALPKMLMDSDKATSARVMSAFMKMKKFDLAQLTRAYQGENA
ncbi:MAG TPA: VOC family protein [Pseudolabrys sp.]|jgi:predicted 3-demethylubiquinone-9 3-methyltransferase (glyoxalase superfamily)|nr:VOC family protein [Pseudolabrys sp.]